MDFSPLNSISLEAIQHEINLRQIPANCTNMTWLTKMLKPPTQWQIALLNHLLVSYF